VPKFGGTIKAAGDGLSVTDMKEVRQQVETVLKKHKATIVVFLASSLFIMGSNETALLGKPVLPTSSCFLVRLTGGRFFVPA
jgi:hypothetical protein